MALNKIISHSPTLRSCFLVGILSNNLIAFTLTKLSKHDELIFYFLAFVTS